MGSVHPVAIVVCSAAADYYYYYDLWCSCFVLCVGVGFSGVAACSRALPAVRKLHAIPNRPVKPERITPSKRGSTPRKRPAARGVDPGRGFGDGTRRTRCEVGGTGRPAAVEDNGVDWNQTGRGEGGSRRRLRSGTISRRVSAARWLEDDREKKKEAGGEGEEEELSDAVFSEERSEESEWDSGEGEGDVGAARREGGGSFFCV